MSTREPLTIIGGGITGLVAAYLAARGGRKVRVLEGAAKPGGLLGTFAVGDTRLEHYYHHFFTHDAELTWLVRELGVQDKLEFLPATMGVFRAGRIFPFNTPKDLLRFSPLSWTGKFRFGLTSLYLGKFANWRKWENTAALDWFYRFAGRAATESIWRPMLEIKFGPYADRVPAAWMIGRLRQRLNSRHEGDERLGYLGGSLEALLEALLAALARLGVEVLTDAPVRRLEIAGGALRAIETPRGTFAGGEFLATIPTIHLAPLLRADAPEYAEQLERIKYFGAVCTILEMDRKLSNIYWLNVADAGFPFGGVIEHTNFIPPSHYGGRHLVYLSRYFEHGNALATLPHDAIAEQMLAPLPRIFPAFQREWVRKVHVFRSLTAATVCDLGFSECVPASRSPIKNLHLATMAHVYPDERSCNNSIRVAAEACRLLGIDTAMVPHGATLSGQLGMEAIAGSGPRG